jgi:hypothetical protein
VSFGHFKIPWDHHNELIELRDPLKRTEVTCLSSSLDLLSHGLIALLLDELYYGDVALVRGVLSVQSLRRSIGLCIIVSHHTAYERAVFTDQSTRLTTKFSSRTERKG